MSNMQTGVRESGVLLLKSQDWNQCSSVLVSRTEVQRSLEDDITEVISHGVQ